MPATILIVDDHHGFRGIVKRLLLRELEVHSVEEARDGEEALQVARNVPPDIVLMDISMPRVDGLEATRRLKAERPETKVIILTVHQDDAYRQAALDSGADAFIAKENVLADLFPTIRQLVGETAGRGM